MSSSRAASTAARTSSACAALINPSAAACAAAAATASERKRAPSLCSAAATALATSASTSAFRAESCCCAAARSARTAASAALTRSCSFAASSAAAESLALSALAVAARSANVRASAAKQASSVVKPAWTKDDQTPSSLSPEAAERLAPTSRCVSRSAAMLACTHHASDATRNTVRAFRLASLAAPAPGQKTSPKQQRPRRPPRWSRASKLQWHAHHERDGRRREQPAAEQQLEAAQPVGVKHTHTRVGPPLTAYEAPQLC